MIEVNLLPGGKKRRRSGPRMNLALPSFAGAEADRWIIGAGVAITAALVGIGYTWVTTSGQIEEVAVQTEEAQEQAARFAQLIQRTEELTARRDSILQRIAVIQEIDQGRFMWPHIMDEMARALPEYTWLTGVTESAPAPFIQLMVDGAAGDNTGITMFMDRLEASPFFRNVRILSSDLTVDGASNEQYYLFQLQVDFEMPGEDYIETVPLFDESVGPQPGSSGAGVDDADDQGGL